MIHHILQYINPEFIIKTFGIFGILTTIFAETWLLLGILFPGDSLLFLSWAYSEYILHPGLNIYIFILLTIIASIIWNQIWYYTWLKLWNNIYKIPENIFFKYKYIDEAKSFYDQHGKMAIVIWRFMPIVRTLVPMFAWVSRVSAKDFLIYNIIWWVLWVTIFMWWGYILWKQFPEIKNHVELAWLCIVAISMWPILYKYISNKYNTRQK